jgi:small subunit ribosomal protein S35
MQDSKSPIPADLPLDLRHVYARQRRKISYAREQALKARPKSVGGVKGFPEEWLAPKKSVPKLA